MGRITRTLTSESVLDAAVIDEDVQQAYPWCCSRCRVGLCARPRHHLLGSTRVEHGHLMHTLKRIFIAVAQALGRFTMVFILAVLFIALMMFMHGA